MRRLTILLALVVVTATLAAPASGAESETDATINAIEWRACYQQYGPFECARVAVPLDYDNPRGRQIGIAVTRLPASNPAARIGSVFLNPGGPGGSGVDFVLGAGPFLFAPQVRERFDLVGFDPRGIIRSSPLTCFASLEESFSILAPFNFPLTPEEEAMQAASDQALNAACEADGGLIRDHMSTANVARDLDMLRQMVGDEGLTFAGYSYGSFLGVTYANMFPDRVRAVVVDGVLDPVAWTTGTGNADTLPFSTRLRSDAGAQATLDEFFRLCDQAGPAACALAGDSADRFDALAERLFDEPLDIIDPGSGESFTLTYDVLIGTLLGALYDSGSWPFMAFLLADLEAQVPAAQLGVTYDAALAATGLAEPLSRYPNQVEGFVGVSCSDSDNPSDHSFWSTAGAEADAQHGYFGRLWTWASSSCASWTGYDDDRFVGPFDASTANKVLVVGTRYDPATRYEGAEAVRALLPNSSLLTVEGWGHTSLFLSRCADRVVSRYLLTGRARDGVVCSQDFDPFLGVQAFAADAELQARHEARKEVMSEVALFPGR